MFTVGNWYKANYLPGNFGLLDVSVIAFKCSGEVAGLMKCLRAAALGKSTSPFSILNSKLLCINTSASCLFFYFSTY